MNVLKSKVNSILTNYQKENLFILFKIILISILIFKILLRRLFKINLMTSFNFIKVY